MKKNILITAGPTREKIDPIRFISNQSTGYLGIVLSQVAHMYGHRVSLILGPTHLSPIFPEINVIRIESTFDLERALEQHIAIADVLMMSSAVSDFRLKQAFTSKIKRQKTMCIEFEKTPDLVHMFSHPDIKKNKLYIGFCLETDHVLENARNKLYFKNLDYIVACSYSPQQVSPFGDSVFPVSILSRLNHSVQHWYCDNKIMFSIQLLSLIMKHANLLA